MLKFEWTSKIKKKKNLKVWAGKIVQQVNVLATKFDNLSLLSGTHIVEGKTGTPPPLTSVHTLW